MREKIQAVIRRRKKLGRFVNPDTGRPVDVFTGRKSGTSYWPIFFYRNGKKMLIPKKEFRGLGGSEPWLPEDEETTRPKKSAYQDLGYHE